ncbi:peptidase M20 [Sporosarcina sp. NCCP-2222]|uniref:M20 metallopeptidase family protein n=1 Tax=Sporosarcina sp. NCCP-2222 TaxID=2935073 RepID=UPI00208A588D|nr:M20 family metallopeptidase [Sporosarcina sp. NCCP-2222]GKV57272.1 peptidase M20 [Sporosarcina sp. NCCP-2222]
MIDAERISTRLSNEIIAIRRHLHQYPELSFQEYQTVTFIRKMLEAWEIPYKTIGETGVYVDIVGNEEGPAIGLRADIDALPIQEEADVPYKSKIDHVMHACGHDGHTSILLGAVHELYAKRDVLEGTVRCIFQPGEEADGAALALIEQGILENPKLDAVIGLHLWPYLPFGSVGVKTGSMTASCDDFKIVIKGKGGHSARPHEAVDAITIATQLIQNLQSITAKSFNPVHPMVIHVGKIVGGEASNVVADTVTLEGTVRALQPDVRKKLQTEVEKVCRAAECLWDANVTVEFVLGAPPIENDRLIANEFEAMAKELLGEEQVFELKDPSMGADDFGYFSEAVPSFYFRLGIKKEGEVSYDLHHPKFHFDDQVLAVGVNLYVNFAKHLLKKVRS